MSFAAACEHRASRFVGAEIFSAVDVEQFGQACAGPVDAGLDGADGAAADPGRFLVREPGSAHQDQRLALIRRKLRQCFTEFPEFNVTVLIRLRLQRFRMMTVAVLDLTPALAILRTEVIAQNSEQPGGHVGTGLEGVDIGECAQQRFLHQVIRAIPVPTQRNRECAEAGHRTKNGFANRLVHRHYCGSFLPLPSRRSIRSLNRSGTPWFTTSSYMARSCWPSRACTSRPSFPGFALSLLLRVAAASIGFCCPTGFRSFIVHPTNPRPGAGAG